MDHTARIISALELYNTTTYRSIVAMQKKGHTGAAAALEDVKKENEVLIAGLRAGHLVVTQGQALVSPSTLKNK